MTPRSLFSIILKLFGVYFLFDAVKVAAQFAGVWIEPFWDSSGAIIIVTVATTVTALFLWIIWLLIFRTDWIIDKLRLDRGFTEEKFDFHIHRSDILRIAVIVIGGVMLMLALPYLSYHVYQLVNAQRFHIPQDPQTVGWTIYYAVQLLGGYLLMSGSRTIVNFIERNRKK